MSESTKGQGLARARHGVSGVRMVRSLAWWARRLMPGFLLLPATIPAAHAIPPIEHWQTPGGTRVYFIAADDLPLLDVSVTFAAGNSRDPIGKAGLSSLVMNNLNSGAGGLSEDDLDRRLADVGAQLAPILDPDQAGVALRTLSAERERNQALDILGKIIQQPEFPAKILEREKARAIAELKEEKTQPAPLADKAFYALLYRDHPYGRNADEHSVASLTRDDVINFYRTYYSSDEATIAIVGAVTRPQAEAIAEQLTGRLPRAQASVREIGPVKPPTQASVEEIPHPAAQSHIVLGYPGMKRNDPDYFPLLVGNFVLGGGEFSSRLTREVREKRGLAYSVGSYFIPLRELGPFRIGLETRKDQTQQALQVVRDTVRDFVQNGPTQEEFELAKQNLAGSFPLRIDSNKKLLNYLGIIGFYRLPLTFLDDYARNIEKVTLAQVKDAFVRRIVPDNMVTVVVALPGAERPQAQTAPPR
jgi:zinc protease